MGVRMGYRRTIKPKNKEASIKISRGVVYKSYRNEKGEQVFVPIQYFRVENNEENKDKEKVEEKTENVQNSNDNK